MGFSLSAKRFLIECSVSLCVRACLLVHSQSSERMARKKNEWHARVTQNQEINKLTKICSIHSPSHICCNYMNCLKHVYVLGAVVCCVRQLLHFHYEDDILNLTLDEISFSGENAFDL